MRRGEERRRSILMTLQTSMNPPQLPPAISHRHIGKGYKHEVGGLPATVIPPLKPHNTLPPPSPPITHLSLQPGFKFSVDYSHLQSRSPACSSDLIYVSFIFHLSIVFSSFFFCLFYIQFLTSISLATEQCTQQYDSTIWLLQKYVSFLRLDYRYLCHILLSYVPSLPPPPSLPPSSLTL